MTPPALPPKSAIQAKGKGMIAHAIRVPLARETKCGEPFTAR